VPVRGRSAVARGHEVVGGGPHQERVLGEVELVDRRAVGLAPVPADQLLDVAVLERLAAEVSPSRRAVRSRSATTVE
jgi:hypothetical protein